MDYQWKDAAETFPDAYAVGQQMSRMVGCVYIVKFGEYGELRQVGATFAFDGVKNGVTLAHHVDGDEAADRLAEVLNRDGAAAIKALLDAAVPQPSIGDTLAAGLMRDAGELHDALNGR